jgi:hypothetical protein
VSACALTPRSRSISVMRSTWNSAQGAQLSRHVPTRFMVHVCARCRAGFSSRTQSRSTGHPGHSTRRSTRAQGTRSEATRVNGFVVLELRAEGLRSKVALATQRLRLSPLESRVTKGGCRVEDLGSRVYGLGFTA